MPGRFPPSWGLAELANDPGHRKPLLLRQSTLGRPAKADGRSAWLIAYQEPHMRKDRPRFASGAVLC